MWCPAPRGLAESLVTAEPRRFFEPPTSTSGTFAGWLGVYLDATGRDKVDWDEVAAIVEDAYRTVAPKTLIAELDQRRTR